MSSTPCAPATGRWPTTRILFALAGTVTLLSAALTAAVPPWFLLLATFAGVNQLLLVATGACPASLVIGRLRSSRRAGVPGMLDPHDNEET